MKFIDTWKNFDDKLRDRAIEELLRFMTLFSTSAALICFFATLIQQRDDMRLSLILLTLMAIISTAWFIKKRKNEEKWGVAKRTGAEIFRIGKTQPTEAERKGIREEKPKKEKKKNIPHNPSKKKQRELEKKNAKKNEKKAEKKTETTEA